MVGNRQAGVALGPIDREVGDLLPTRYPREVGPAFELLVLRDRDRVVVLPLVVARGLRRTTWSSLRPMNSSGIRPCFAKSISVGGLRWRLASAMSASTPVAAGTQYRSQSGFDSSSLIVFAKA